MSNIFGINTRHKDIETEAVLFLNNLDCFSNFTTRLTALYQPNGAENYWKENMICYASDFIENNPTAKK